MRELAKGARALLAIRSELITFRGVLLEVGERPNENGKTESEVVTLQAVIIVPYRRKVSAIRTENLLEHLGLRGASTTNPDSPLRSHIGPVPWKNLGYE
jgi:hypothetical protein